jgi:hypothetical protein
MNEYVKICPVCKHQNPEDSDICEIDGVYLGMIPSVRAKDMVDSSVLPADATVMLPDTNAAGSQELPSPSGPLVSGEVRTTQRMEESAPVIYLDLLGTERVFIIQSGFLIGQAHPNNPADVQLEQIPDVEYVHRQHARFLFENGEWSLIPVDQKSLGRDFTNPTYLNQRKLIPGQPYTLHNGDRLVLGKIPFIIRIIQP